MRSCLVCAAADVEEILDLGVTALANKFLTSEELSKVEPRFPLRLGFCSQCAHVQLLEIVPSRLMFEDYLYVSAASDTLRAHLHDLSDVIVHRCRLTTEDLVVDIGCNDATLLRGFKRHNVKTLGVDPAENLAALNGNSDVERYIGFFNSATASRIVGRWGRASVITLTNTFPHIQDLHDFLIGIQTLLAPGGTLVIEAHYLLDVLEQDAFDTIYHEHVSYWALGPMKRLFATAGLEIVSAERLPVHHGQLRVFVQRTGEGKANASVSAILTQEQSEGIDKMEVFHAFRDRTIAVRQNLRRTILDLRRESKRIVAYGAPAKGNTLLGFLKVGPEMIEYIVDRSPLKQGRYTPGTHIPVFPTERLLKDQPDYVVLLAWNFIDEILEQQQEYRRRGGKFIIPIPTVRFA
ncbi:MAG TPA: class I SAM-dependent methyltransferase [Terriglobia bacterium]|nr:class I SAM-dependent methyltransferase [Terriglobia bacterium]